MFTDKAKVSLLLDEVVYDCSCQNWDGYGAEACKDSSYQDARKFLDLLEYNFTDLDFCVMPDGQVSMDFYRVEDKRYSISFFGCGQLIYAGIFGKKKFHGREIFETEIPELILDHLKFFKKW